MHRSVAIALAGGAFGLFARDVGTRFVSDVVENLRRQEFLRMHSGEKSDDGLKDC